MAVTEPSTGSDTTSLSTTAVRQGDRYVISGQKVWTSRLQHSDLMIVLAAHDAAGRGQDADRRACRC